MGLIADLKKLIEKESTNGPDESWPNEQAVGYWEDTSIEDLPNTNVGVTTEQWSPTYQQNIPYRGVEDHGVPVDGSKFLVAPDPIRLGQPELPANIPEKVDTKPTIDPIPVTVVEMPTPTDLQKRVETAQYSNITNTMASAVKVVSRHTQRTRVRLACQNGTVVIGVTDSIAGLQQMGWPLATMTNNPEGVDLNTTQSIWAYGTSGTADTVYVLEEYDSQAHEKNV